MDRSRLTRMQAAREAWEDFWPGVSRVAGLGTLLYTVVAASSADKPTYVAVVLVLLTAPTITGVQDRRNERRDGGDS